jgi:hypothetical protein
MYLERMLFKEYFQLFEQVIQYNLVWGSLRLINRESVDEKRKLLQTRLLSRKLKIFFSFFF